MSGGKDSTTLLHYMLRRINSILGGLLVYPENMLSNIEKTKGLLFSQKVLLALTHGGMSREDAYSVVQAAAMRTWNNEGTFLDILFEDERVKQRFTKEKLRESFDPRQYLGQMGFIFDRVFRDE